MEQYTLPYILRTTKLDTINDNNLIYEEDASIYSLVNKGLDVAMYLKSKEMLLNMLDLIYIRGKELTNIGAWYNYYPCVSFFVEGFNNYNYFHNFQDYENLKKICIGYASSFWHLGDKKLNKKEQKELEMLLSTEYRTKIKEQLRSWIEENVNFEE
jgi:hypothetical protein